MTHSQPAPSFTPLKSNPLLDLNQVEVIVRLDLNLQYHYFETGIKSA